MKNLLFIIVLTVSLYGQNVVPISNLRNNSSNGVPVDTGIVFTVSGIVTASNQFGATGGPASLQDETAGISLFGSAFSNSVLIGDSVTITSKLTHYNGLTQFNYTASNGSSFIKHSSNKSVIPLVLTVSQVNGQQWNGFEEYESRLVRINNVQFSQTGNFAGGTNYNISDATGTMQLRVDNDVSTIIGSTIPSNRLDVIGILGQYDSSSPYSTGYQIIPRSILDLIYDGTPQILSDILAADITTSSFTVYFQTARKGNSIVKYGKTTSLEMDSVVINNDTTVHVVPVTGLQPLTTYYYKAFSRNLVGESQSSLLTVTTASDNPESGKIEVFFNYPVDTTVAIPGNAAEGNVNFQTKLVEKIAAARYSIDLAVYSFNGLDAVTAALINAKNRGVKIRVVYDSRATQASMQQLINAGIQISRRVNTDGIMHNKFFIFDARDTVSNNDLVWTGSYNITSLELNWKNNVVTINDHSLALAYTVEFEEMWGSNTDTPNPANAKFGASKLDNTQHIFNVGGREIDLYFSPSDLTTSRIVNALNTANYAIYFAQYAFTRSEPATAIKNRYNAGVTSIRGIVNQVNDTGSEFQFLSTFAEMFGNTSAGTLHHKYAMVDPSHPASMPLVVTGSHNWSTNAETKNDENTLIIKDLYVANKFLQEFKKRYNDVGGVGSFVIPVVEVDDSAPVKDELNIYQNYPNPFSSITTIRVSVSSPANVKIELFDVLGRYVTTLFDREVPKGLVVVDFDPVKLDKEIAAGTYLYLVNAGGTVKTGKMVFLR